MEVKLDDVSSAEVIDLLQEHLADMQLHSPPESVHALDINAFKSPDIKLWTAWSENTLLGCGALKNIGDRHGEIKSMRTKQAYLRRGVADAILDVIIENAKLTGMERISLETGATEEFLAAQAFYHRRGFIETVPFGSYKIDPYSLFLTLELIA